MPSASTSRAVLAVLATLALILTLVMIRPFAGALFVAAVLAAAMNPWVGWLARFLGGRRSIASGILTVGLVAVVLLPLATLGAVLAKQVVEGIAWVRQTLQGQGLQGLVAYLPGLFQDPALQLLTQLPREAIEIQQLVEREGGRAFAALSGLITATGTALLQTGLFLVAFFFFLSDGRWLVDWVKEAIPLKPGQAAELLEDFRRVTVAVLASTLLTAGLQALVALVGFLVARVPNSAFFTLVVFVLALVPVGLATAAVLLVAVLQLANGHTLSAVFLAAWAVGAVAMVDNLVKPLLLRSGLAIHGGVIFFALIGGLAAFGVVGIVAGPLVVAFLVAVVRLHQRDSGGAR